MQIHKLSLLTALLFFSVLPLPAQVSPHVAEAVFAITPEESTYLRYLRYENSFDSAAVGYTFGEIRIESNQQTTRIPLSVYPDEMNVTEGSPLQGEDTVLLPLGTSEPFMLPATGTIGFHRDLHAYGIPCGLDKGGQEGGGNGTWEDFYWALGAGRIPDRTEFVVQIVRDSDGVVLATIDSVGMLPNLTTRLAPRYGTYPTRTNHTVSIPPGLGGTRVYLRVSPRRYGPTPYGMAMNKTQMWVSRSTLYEYTATGTERCSQTDHVFLRNAYFAQLIRYSDSVKLASGRLPDSPLVVLHDTTQEDLYRRRYTQDTTINGAFILYEKDSLTFATQYWGNALSKTTPRLSRLGSTAYILQVAPNPVTGPVCTLALAGQNVYGVPLRIELYDVEGRRLALLWQGNSLSDEPVTLHMETYPRGVYLLVLSTESGLRLDAAQVIKSN